MKPSVSMHFDDREQHVTIRIKRENTTPRISRSDVHVLASGIELALEEYGDRDSVVMTGLESIRCRWDTARIPDWLTTACSVAVHRLGWRM